MEIGISVGVTGIPALRPGGAPWTPAALFAGGEAGTWPGGFDPAGGRVFNSNTGQAAASVGQGLGLYLDRSQGVDLGPELIANGGFDADLSGWTVNGSLWSWVAGRAFLNNSNSAGDSLQQAVLPPGWFRLALDVEILANMIRANLVLVTPNTVDFSGSGLRAAYAKNDSGVVRLLAILRHGGATTAYIDNVSVRSVPGNHAVQAAVGSRPTLMQAGGGLYYLYSDGGDSLNVTLPTGTYTRAWVTHDGDVTIEAGVSISAPENVLRAATIADVLYIDRALTGDEAAKLSAHWEGLAA